MYRIEESTCNIVGTFRRPPVIRRPGHCAPFSPLSTPLHAPLPMLKVLVAMSIIISARNYCEIFGDSDSAVSSDRPSLRNWRTGRWWELRQRERTLQLAVEKQPSNRLL